MTTPSTPLLATAVGLALAAAGCEKKESAPAAAASASAAAPAADPCPAADNLRLDGPRLCVKAPRGYLKPNLEGAAAPANGTTTIRYTEDGQPASKQTGWFVLTYNPPRGATAVTAQLDYQAKGYCDSPPSYEEVGGGKGKYFLCRSTKLEGRNYGVAAYAVDGHFIDCASQSFDKADIDAVCKNVTKF